MDRRTGAIGGWSASAPGITVAERVSARLMMVRLGRGGDAARDAIAAVAGVALSDAPNVVSAGTPRAIWMGPHEWMLVDSPADAAAIEAAAGDATVLANDVGAGRYVVVLTGADAPDLLAKAVSLDLHPRAFAADATAMTLFAQVPVVLERTVDGGWRLYFDVSYRGYVRTWFDDALIEFGGAAALPSSVGETA